MRATSQGPDMDNIGLVKQYLQPMYSNTWLISSEAAIDTCHHIQVLRKPVLPSNWNGSGERPYPLITRPISTALFWMPR